MNEEIKGVSEILALSMTVNALCEINDKVKMTGDMTVEKAGSGEPAIGTLIYVPDEFPGLGTVATKFSRELEVELGATISIAGTFAKLGAPLETTQRFVKFIPGTDDPTLNEGVFLKSGVAGDRVSLLTD